MIHMSAAWPEKENEAKTSDRSLCVRPRTLQKRDKDCALLLLCLLGERQALCEGVPNLKRALDMTCWLFAVAFLIRQ